MYMVVSEEAVNPIYFVSKALAGPETRYQNIEKGAIAFVNASRKIQRYSLTHSIVVRTNLDLKQVLHRLTKWSIEFSDFKVFFKARKALKAQSTS